MIRFACLCLLLCTNWALDGRVKAEPLTYALPEETATFKNGPGVEAAKKYCAACHSADYIVYQPPGKGPAFWEAEVQKMIKSYGAPIDASEAKTVADYLASVY